MDKWNFDGCKLLWHMDRVHAHFRDGKKIVPLHIDIGATKACNARCRYCYGIYQQMTGDKIPEDILIRLFEDAPKLGVKSLTLTGDGEPTLNPGVYEACERGKALGLDIGLATNGIALDNVKIASLVRNLTWLRFNLSAHDQKSYIHMHGVDRWNVVSDNILKAVQMKKETGANVTIGLQMVLIPDALESVIPEALFAVAMDVDYFVIKQFSDPGCEEMGRFNLSWYDSKEVKYTLKAAEMLSNHKTQIVPKYTTIEAKGHRPYDTCVDCPLIFQISGSGKCYPCGFLFGNEDYCYGDLRKNSLGEILESGHYWELIHKLRYDFNVHTMCKGACRHDKTNEFVWKYLNKPEHINFI